jgi:hypothetical protein
LTGGSFSALLAQDSTSLSGKVFSSPDKLFASIDRSSSKLQNNLSKQTARYMQRLSRQEKKLRDQLAKKDSGAAARLFNGTDSQYLTLQNSLQKGSGLINKSQQLYSGHLDSITTALNFLQQNKLLGQRAQVQSGLQSSLGQLAGLQNKLDQTATIQKILQQRQQFLQEQLGKFGLADQLGKYKQTVYYYRAQMDAYKKTWEDPSKVEEKAMNLLSQTKPYRDFFNKNSALAGLFHLPGASDADAAAGAIPGLQTRSILQQGMQQRFGSDLNVQQSMQGGMDAAQSQLGQAKDKLSQQLNGSSGGGDASMPDFKPNNQKTKSFLQRLQLGANVQSTGSNYFFPVTTDLGASLGV